MLAWACDLIVASHDAEFCDPVVTMGVCGVEWFVHPWELGARKAKEMLFTVVDRESKYKSKNFIDTVVYRGSDVTASWLFKGLMTLGLSVGAIAWVYLPVLAIWGLGAWRLGRHYEALRDQAEALSKAG